MSTTASSSAPDYSSREKQQRRLLLLVAVIVLIAAGLGILWWFLRGQYWIETNDAYVTGNITPVDSLSAGTVKQVRVENTEYVHAGQILAALQGSQTRLAMEQAGAHLAATVRQVRQDFARVQALQQSVQAQLAERQKLEMDLNRYQQSLPSGAVSRIRIENTQNEITSAAAQVAEAQAKLRGARAIVAGSTVSDNPLVQQAATAFENADINWQRRLIRAPISGYVAQRVAYPGLKVAAGQHLFSVVPLNDLWVVANIKETAMRHVRPGQAVQLTSYYYGHQVRYHGTVLGLLPGAGSAFSILPPENATGNYIHIVERVPVRIAIPARELAEHPLRPGLSMIAELHWKPGQKHSVLQPLTTPPTQGYESTVYRTELLQAQQRAEVIIRQNS